MLMPNVYLIRVSS